MVDISTQIEIEAPIEAVRNFASNPDNAPRWYVNIKSIEWKTPKPLQVGSQLDFVAHFMGRKLAYTYEVREMNERKFIMSTSQGPFPMETTYTWEKLDEGRTLMKLRNAGNPSGFSKLLSPLMKMMMRKANTKDLRCLKIILENQNS